MRVSNEEMVARLQELWREIAALELAYSTKKICFYEPIGQQPAFHAAESAAVRLVLGSNRSGKSVAGVVEAIAHSLGYRPWLPEDHPNRIVHLSNGEPIPVPNVGRIIAQNYQQAINQTIWPKIQEWAPAGWYKVRKDNRGIPIELKWRNGSVVHFMSDDQDDMAFEGTNGHWWWGDEPFGKNKYTGLKRGLVDYSGHAWMTMTPLTQPWIYDTLVARANEKDGSVKMFKFSIWDNCTENGGYLRREDIEEFLSDLREEELEARLHGNFMHLAGRVYKEWSPEPPYWMDARKLWPKTGRPPDRWPRVCIIDPHPRKPICVSWIAVSPDEQIYVYRDLFNPRLRTVRQVADEMKRLEGWKWDEEQGYWRRGEDADNVVFRIIDWSAQENEPTSGLSIRKKFHEEGIITQLAKKRNAEAGYDAIHEALLCKNEWSEPGLIVTTDCEKTKNDFLKFVWDEWSTDKQRQLQGDKQTVRKTNDDAIDNIRYFFQSGLNYRMLVSAIRRLEQRNDFDEDHNGRNLFTGAQGPMTRRERNSGRRSARIGIGARQTY